MTWIDFCLLGPLKLAFPRMTFARICSLLREVRLVEIFQDHRSLHLKRPRPQASAPETSRKKRGKVLPTGCDYHTSLINRHIYVTINGSEGTFPSMPMLRGGTLPESLAPMDWPQWSSGLKLPMLVISTMWWYPAVTVTNFAKFIGHIHTQNWTSISLADVGSNLYLATIISRVLTLATHHGCPHVITWINQTLAIWATIHH